MNVKKIFLWGLPVLIVGLVVSSSNLEQAFQRRRQLGWTTHHVSGKSVAAIAFDEQGRALIGTYHDGVSVFDGDTWSTYIPENSGLADERVRAIAFDEQGRAWFGTSGYGVSVFDGNTRSTYTPENSGLVHDSVGAIAFDEQGRAWFGTKYGVSILQSNELTPIPQAIIVLRNYSVSPDLNWFLPLLFIGLWLAILLNTLPGVLAGLALGLGSLVLLGVHPTWRALALPFVGNPGVFAMIGGMIAGIIGGLAGRMLAGRMRRPIKKDTFEVGCGIGLAIIGVIGGFVIGFIYIIFLCC